MRKRFALTVASIIAVSLFDKTVDGYNQHDVYVCRSGEQSYLPSFTWHGFRYCEVCGLKDEQATLDTVEFVSTHSDLPKVCDFKCDNETVNKLVQMTLQSDKSNFVFYPYDCPQREKNGWTADASLSAEQMLYTFDAKASLEQWLLQIRNAQKENGMLPGIIPTAGWGFDFGNGPAWDSVIVELPYQLYRFYGDEKVVKDNAEAIRKYFDYVTTRLNADGLANFGLGDWVQTYTKNEGDF
ncbi:MAG: family 78 glycoside hydrolase catalytic domain [Clostridiales bacterium]|nr:MAG: family 78 glycoside hydrolase catalytic domain [Clostridiales bacterium]